MTNAIVDPVTPSVASDQPLLAHDRCAQEQVQIIGRIQSHGLLFALSEPDLIVRQMSANASTELGIPPEDLLGGPFRNVIGAQQFETFKSQLLEGPLIAATSVRLQKHNSMLEMHCIAHRQNAVLIVELEFLKGALSLGTLNIDAHIRSPLARLEAAFECQTRARRASPPKTQEEYSR